MKKKKKRSSFLLSILYLGTNCNLVTGNYFKNFSYSVVTGFLIFLKALRPLWERGCYGCSMLSQL